MIIWMRWNRTRGCGRRFLIPRGSQWLAVCPPTLKTWRLDPGKAVEWSINRPGGGLLVARSAATAEGEIYTLVGRFPRFALRTQTDLSDVLLRLLAVAMTGGIVCYGLARYLTSPVGRLQKVTRQLAQGDLKTRAGLTLRKRGDEFADLAEDFDRMAERIESLITSQRVLLSDISHELRSPLARLGVALELARKRAPQEAQTSLDRIELEAARMNELIGQLLKLTELENRGQPDDLQLVSLTQLVEEVVADANYEAARQNRAVRMTDSTDCVVRGAPDLLRSAIENVVRNALRYTADDTEVEVAVRSRRGDGRPYAQVVVSDHGPGVPETELHEIFRPFLRVGDARDRQSGGSGLGLAIAERVVRIHGGAVRASNVSSGGLRVQLDLPGEA